MRISDWSSDVCSSYLNFTLAAGNSANNPDFAPQKAKTIEAGVKWDALDGALAFNAAVFQTKVLNEVNAADPSDIQSGSKRVRGFELSVVGNITDRSEEHTSELQSLMRISYAVFCLKKKKKQTN